MIGFTLRGRYYKLVDIHDEEARKVYLFWSLLVIVYVATYLLLFVVGSSGEVR